MKKKLVALGLLFATFAFTVCNLDNHIISYKTNAEAATDVIFLAEVETENMVDCSQFFYNSIKSRIAKPIVLKHSDENAVFECTADKGILVHGLQYDKRIALKPNEGFSWYPDATDFEYAYVEVILINEQNIVGYAVVEFYKINVLGCFKARLLKSALFPKIDGEYQSVTKKQVNTAIEKVKLLQVEENKKKRQPE